MIFRPIQAQDNVALASIIRAGIESLNLPIQGTAHSDPTTDNLFDLFLNPQSAYFVVEDNGVVLGGCGIYPTQALPPKHAELVRFFLDPAMRGKGVGKQLMRMCEQKATALGYTHLYLESFPDMQAAIYLYEKFAYKRLANPLGNSGHFSCNVWMLKELHP